MAYYCDDEYEVAVLNDEVFVVHSFVVDEGALLSSNVTETALALLLETAPIFGDGWFIAPGDLFEVAVLDDAITAAYQCSDVADETAVLGDTIYPTVGGDFAETAVLDDATFPSTLSVFEESAILNDLVTYIITAETTVLEEAVVHGFVLPLYTDVVFETAVGLGDAVESSATAAAVVEETAMLDDAAFSIITVTTVTDESAVLDDSTVQVAAGYTDVLDPFYGQGYAILPRVGDAWVAFAPNVAMSRYANLLAAEYLMVDGHQVGLAETGVYELTSDGLVPSEVLTGVTDFDDPQRNIDGSKRKHVMAVYAEGESVAAYNMRVLTDDNGTPVERVYAFPAANGAHTRNTRCTLGKLTWARNWQFAFTNSEPHTLREARALIELTARRV